MAHEIHVTEREKGAKVEIVLNGITYRITVWDKDDYITVQCVDGRMIINPSVSNEIKISTDES